MKKQQHYLPKALYHPKHWGSWLLAFWLFLLVNLLPYRALMALGALLGRVMEKLMPYRLLISKTNIRLCFATRDWQAIYRRHVTSLGKGVFEMAMAWFLWRDNFQVRVEHEGEDAVLQAKAAGKGILFLGIHTTNLDFCAPLLSQRHPVSLMYQKAKNPVFDYLITRARLRHCLGVIDRKNMRDLLIRLKNGEAVWYGCDQDFGSNAKSVFTPFFGVSAYTLPSYAKLAQKTGAVVIPVAGFRNDDTGSYTLRYLPAIDVIGMDETQAALAMNQGIERLIAGYEDQYYWVHRRFKTRPAGEAAVYPPKPSRR